MAIPEWAISLIALSWVSRSSNSIQRSLWFFSGAGGLSYFASCTWARLGLPAGISGKDSSPTQAWSLTVISVTIPFVPNPARCKPIKSGPGPYSQKSPALGMHLDPVVSISPSGSTIFTLVMLRLKSPYLRSVCHSPAKANCDDSLQRVVARGVPPFHKPRFIASAWSWA